MSPATPPMLSSIDQITPEWVRLVLEVNALGVIPEVTRIRLEPIGAGNASNTKRLLIDYKHHSENLPASLICKFPPLEHEARLRSTATGTYAREAGAYRLIAEQSACSIPRLYLAADDPDGINLVMEDLTRTACPGDQIAGCNAVDAAAVIDELASLHRAFSYLHASDAPSWIAPTSVLADQWGDVIRLGAHLAPERFGDKLLNDEYATINHGAALTDAWLRLPEDHVTLTHGDPRVDNILFQRHDHQTQSFLIDWQMAGLRAPMYDVAYFLSSSLPVEARRNHERDLIARYIQKTSGADEAAAFDDYRCALLASFTLTILSIAALPRTPQVDLLLLTLLKRNIATLNDWDGLAAIETKIKRQML